MNQRKAGRRPRRSSDMTWGSSAVHDVSIVSPMGLESRVSSDHFGAVRRAHHVEGYAFPA